MKVFKVVTLDNESILVNNTNMSVTYNIGEVTRPILEHTSLMAFNSAKQAHSFCKKHRIREYKVLACNAELGEKFWVSQIILDRILLDLYIDDFTPNRSRLREAFLSYFNDDEWPSQDVVESFGDPPKGTVFCSWIEPIQEL